MGKNILLWALQFAAGLLACSLTLTFVSEDNQRIETIGYNGFDVSVSAGGKIGARKAIILHVKPRREVNVMVDRLRVYFRNEPIGYDIFSEGKPVDEKNLQVFRGEKDIMYSLEVDGVFALNDSLLFFAPGIFHVGEQLYDLDTLVFKIPR